MGQARSGKVELTVEQSRLIASLIRSVRVERIIGRCLCPRGSGDSPRPWIGNLWHALRSRWEDAYVLQDSGNWRSQ
jgi:hypothetical protein